MQVLVKSKTSFYTQQFDDVTDIAYNGSTHIITISYGESSTVTFNAENYLIFITKIVIGG